MKNQDYRIRNISFSIALSIVLLMLIVYLLDDVFHLKLYEYGLYPRKLSGLLGILTSPFIHSTKDYGHIFNNSVPMFVLTWLLFYTYRTVATKVFLYTYFFTGLLVWIFARPSFHIGMSGVIYGLTSFLIVSGFIRKDLRSVSLSLLVIFLYGSLIWGVFPLDPQISWEGHFFGFFTGIILAIVYKKAPPQPQKYYYEIEEELGLDEDYDYPYWLENNNTENQNKTKEQKDRHITIHYTYVPKKDSSDGK